MKKIIIFSFLVVVIATVCVIGNVKDTAIFSGVLVENNDKVDVKITRTTFDKIFNKMSHDIIVEGNGIDYRYVFSGEIFDMDKYYAAPIRRMSSSGLVTQGYLFFDDKMKNIVIETGEEIVFSGEKEFLKMVIK